MRQIIGRSCENAINIGGENCEKVVFVISNGFEKAGRATRVFQFAQVACEKGHDVKVFLVDDEIHWAQFGMAEGVKASAGEEKKMDKAKIPCLGGYPVLVTRSASACAASWNLGFS